MVTLTNLESFVRSAELGSFSAASRKLHLSPAAVSKNVARLEASLGVLLFQRTTRQLALTEDGESFLTEARSGLDSLQDAMRSLSGGKGAVSGTLKITMPYAFGLEKIIPLLSEFKKLHPKVVLDCLFENGLVDLIRDGFDVAIGGGLEFPLNVVARKLVNQRLIVVASPAYFEKNLEPYAIEQLSDVSAIAFHSHQTGKEKAWVLRHEDGREHSVSLDVGLVLSDYEAVCRSAAMGMGIALVPICNATSYLNDGTLIHLLPEWFADAGTISIYFAGRRLLPLKSRVFIDFLVEHFERTTTPSPV